MVDQKTALEEQQWYNDLVEDCQRFILEINEKSFGILSLYHELGQRILKEKDKAWSEGTSMEELFERLSDEVGKPKRTLYYATRFYQEYTDIKDSPYTEGTYWFTVTKDLDKLEANNKKKDDPLPTKETGEDLEDQSKQHEEMKAEKINEKPNIGLIWNEEVGLWQLVVDDETMGRLDVIKFKNEIDEFLAK